MSVIAAELLLFGPASRPQDDTSTSGGAIDLTWRPVFTQFVTTNNIVEIVSDGADTRVVTVRGRDAAGVIATTTITANGTTPVSGAQTYERILAVSTTTNASRTITVKQGAAGATIGTIPVNEVGFYAFFDSSVSAGTQKIRYEKLFWKNTNSTTTLTTSALQVTADSNSTIINIGIVAAINDSTSVANRLTDPGVTFVGLSTAQNVPGGNLASGDRIGAWMRQTLAINNVALGRTSNFTTQLNGQTT